MATRGTTETTVVESFHAGAAPSVIDDSHVIPAPPLGRDAIGDDPRRSIRAVFRRWPLLILCILIGSALGWLSAEIGGDSNPAPLPVDHYQATHVIVLDSNVPDTQPVLNLRNLNTLAKRITVGEIPLNVAARSDLPVAAVSNQVRVIIRSDSDAVEIIAVGRTREQAEELADLYADELIAELEADAENFATEARSSAEARLNEAENSLRETRAAIQAAEAAEDEAALALLEEDEAQYLAARTTANAILLEVQSDGTPIVPLESLQRAEGRSIVIPNARFDELVQRAAQGQNIELLFGDEAEAESSGGALSAVSSRLPDGVLPRLGFGALAGLIVGLTTALFLNRLDNRIRSKRQVEQLLDLPVVAEVPTMKRQERRSITLLAQTKPRGAFAEQHRGLASTITYAGRTRSGCGTQVVMVTSPGPAEGKTTTVANLGTMLAEAGHRVLVINCDFRRPTLHLHMEAEDSALTVHKTSVPGVDLVANVELEPDVPPAEVVSTQRTVIREACGQYDFIVIDTAPLIATNDALDLLDLVDDVVLVLRAGRTRIQAADRAAEVLERRRAHVLGVAITGVDSRTSDGYYYGSYYDETSVGPAGPRPLHRRSDKVTADVKKMLGTDEPDELDRLFSRLRAATGRVKASAGRWTNP